MDDRELEARLRSLGELSPPTSPLLDCQTMHVGASRMQRRQQLMVAIPSILLVVVVLASAVALRNNTPLDLSVAGPNQVATQGTAAPAGLTDRDRELLDFAESTIRLRHELHLEALDAASYTSTNKAVGSLSAQRSRTDAAQVTFSAKVTASDPGRESQMTKDALAQADNRLKSLSAVRLSVDGIQTDAVRLAQAYSSISLDLGSVLRSLALATDNPRMFRGLMSLANLGRVSNAETTTAAILTVSVEIGYFAALLPTGAQPSPARDAVPGAGCGEDASGAGDRCPAYAEAIKANDEMSRDEQAFDEMANGQQKQIKRTADAGSSYDELKRHAFEDGQGHNDLRGTQPGTTAVDPAGWRQVTRDRVTKLFTAELQTLDTIRAG